jgi:glycosyltransferase involved in cell wall biosynthesis
MSKSSEGFEMDRRKHILVSVGYYPPDHGGGGLRLHRTYRRLMEKMPLRVTVLARSGRTESQGWHNLEGIHIYRTAPVEGAVGLMLETSNFFLKNGSAPFDLVHASGSGMTVISSCAWARLLGVPILRETTMSSTLSSGGGLKGSILRWTFRQSAVNIARTAQEEAKLKKMGVNDSQLFAASYPVDDHAFTFPTWHQKEISKRKLGLSEEARVHLIVGRLGDRKNQLFGLQVISKLPENHHLILVGPPRGNYPDRLHDKAKELGVSKRVRIFAEHKSDVSLFFWAADTCWITSRREGVPNVMKEALVCGVAVVMNEGLGLKNYISEDAGVFQAPLDPPVFVEAVEMATSRTRSEAARKSIRDAGREKFGVSAWDEDFTAMLAQLLDLPRGSAAPSLDRTDSQGGG